MKFLTSLLFTLTLLGTSNIPLTSAKETAPMTGSRAEAYRSGAVHMELMAHKRATYNRNRDKGIYRDSRKWKQIKSLTKCKNGYATYAPTGDSFRCKNIDLAYFASHADLGSVTGEGSSMWGWTARDGREFAAIGQADGAAFVEVERSTGKLVYLGRLPHPVGVLPEIWREIRMMNDYAVIGSEAEGHGVQIFDMKTLLPLSAKSKSPGFKPKTFNPATEITGYFDGLPIGSTHNIVTNPERNYAIAVGARPRNSTCAAGLIFIDLENPRNPTSPGCNPDDGYVHDAQCLPYRGPDKRYQGRDVCYAYNENSLTIYDVTDRTNSTIISITSYEGAAYTHQGSLLDTNWHEYLIMDDEYDEYDATGLGADGFPVSYIWDIRDLKKPKQTGYFKSSVRGVDHNQYVKNGLVYQSNYGAGLRILDVKSVKRDPTGKGVKEIGFFDVYPEDDNEVGGGVIDFVGSWSSYGLFESGWILINTIERGVFSVRYTGK